MPTTGSPTRLAQRVEQLPALLRRTIDVAVIRILGGRRAWDDGLDALLAGDVPVVVLGGEQVADAELMQLSTVPGGVVAEAHSYLAHGGPANLAQLFHFLSDAILLTGFGFDAPAAMPTWGRLDREPTHGAGPTVAVLYYRAHQASGNTAFVHALADAIDTAGGRALPIYCSSLRTAEPELFDSLREADAIVVTVLAGRRRLPAAVGAGGADDEWDVGALADLDVPILQGLCLTSSRSDWADSDDGLTPLDSATQVAIPEFDGRIITVPFSFKEVGKDGLISYVADPERAARVAGIAVKHANLRHIAPADKRVALMLSAYPTKHARIGNAVGLDTPASTVRLLRALRRRGLRHRRVPRCGRTGRRCPLPRADRRGRPGRAVADPGAARRQSGAYPGRALPALVRRARPRTARLGDRALVRGAGLAVRRPLGTRTARSCSPRCAPATSS